MNKEIEKKATAILDKLIVKKELKKKWRKEFMSWFIFGVETKKTKDEKKI